MASIPTDLRYTKDHEWARVDPDGNVRIGITEYAQSHLGDVVMVELPRVDQGVEAGKPFGTVESPKSVSDLYAPVSGRVREVNGELDQSPELVNKDPYGNGWVVIIEAKDVRDLDGLLTAEAYEAHLATLEG